MLISVLAGATYQFRMGSVWVWFGLQKRLWRTTFLFQWKGSKAPLGRMDSICSKFFSDLTKRASHLCFFQIYSAKMRVAIIGQSQFAGEVYKLLQKDGHKIAGVFTIPDTNGRADPLGGYALQALFRRCVNATVLGSGGRSWTKKPWCCLLGRA